MKYFIINEEKLFVTHLHIHVLCFLAHLAHSSWEYDTFFFFNFYFYFILLKNTVLVLPYIDMNPPRVYMRSQTWTPLPPPSP